MFDVLVLSLPVVTAMIGWLASRLTVWLTFYPVVSRRFRWQGLVPRNLERMMHMGVDELLPEAGDLDRVFRELGPSALAKHLTQQVSPRLEEYIDDVMYEVQPVLWDNLPLFLRNRFYQWARAELPGQIDEMVDEFGRHLEALVDLKALLSAGLPRHPDLMNRVLEKAAAVELRSAINRGGIIGGLIGLPLVPLWSLLPSLWLLPAAGFMVGLVAAGVTRTGLLLPLESRGGLFGRGQGLLLRRQEAIADSWSHSVAEQLLTTDAVADAILNGREAGLARAIIQKHMRPLLDHSAAVKLSAQVAVGITGYSELKEAVNRKALTVFEEAFRNPSLKRACVPQMTEALAARMRDLSPRQFQRFLWPALGEGGLKLMLAGAAVGTVLGSAPLLLFLGGLHP